MKILSREEAAKISGGLDRNYLRKKSAHMATKKKDEANEAGESGSFFESAVSALAGPIAVSVMILLD